MRTITFLTIAFFISTCAVAQDWQTVTSNRTASFEFSRYPPSLKKIRVIKIDSISMQGSDSVFFNYHTIRDEDFQTCYQHIDTGWIGSSIIIKNDGVNVFFNKNNDSIFIKTLEGIGHPWHLVNLSGGNYLEAVIISSQIETILGASDSVKTILLNAKNNLGQPIFHAMNNQKIKFSQHHGILTPYRFFYFPNDTTHFEISGITNPVSGKQLLTKRDIYNFDVGDMFQWEGMQRNGNWANWVQTCNVQHVLSKAASLVGDSITYVINNYYYRATEIWPGPVTYFYAHDTSTVTISFAPIATIDLLPNQWYPLSGFDFGVVEQLSDSTLYYNRRMRMQSDYYTEDQVHNCITEFIGDCVFWNYYYAEGLGNVAIYDGTSAAGCIDYKMTYYQKGSETWGTLANCPVVLDASEYYKSLINVFPNPFSNILNIDCSLLEMHFSKIEISDAAGKVVKSIAVDGSSNIKIFVDDLRSGFYLLNVQSEHNSFHYKLLKN